MVATAVENEFHMTAVPNILGATTLRVLCGGLQSGNDLPGWWAGLFCVTLGQQFTLTGLWRSQNGLQKPWKATSGFGKPPPSGNHLGPSASVGGPFKVDHFLPLQQRSTVVSLKFTRW